MKKIILLVLSLSVSAQADKQVVSPSSQYTESLELKLAKLWGRFDELEIKVKKQAERIKILEQGLMLGVIPDELIKDKLNLATDPNQDPLGWGDAKPSPPPKPSPKVDQRQPHIKDKLSYDELLKKAQQAFSSGSYGPAIAYYQRIEKHYSARTAEGQTSFWIGLSWYYLKEFEQASEQFLHLINSRPTSPWIPKAKFYQAKISLLQGLPHKALKQFNELIAAYPNSDTSEMASYEIKLLKERL